MNPSIQSEVRTEYTYEWGLCTNTTSALVISLAILLAIKITFTFVLALRQKNCKYKKAYEKLKSQLKIDKEIDEITKP